MLATATVMAGLRWPPDTPPDTRMPSITPMPHLQTRRRVQMKHKGRKIRIKEPIQVSIKNIHRKYIYV